MPLVEEEFLSYQTYMFVVADADIGFECCCVQGIEIKVAVIVLESCDYQVNPLQHLQSYADIAVSQMGGFKYCSLTFTDGGLAANNPAACLITLLLQEKIDSHKCNAMSIGTGIIKEFDLVKDYAGHPIKQGLDALQSSMAGGQEIADQLASQFFSTDRYCPVNIPLHKEIRMDDSIRAKLELPTQAELLFKEDRFLKVLDKWIQNL